MALKGARFGAWRRVAGVGEGLAMSVVVALAVAAVVYAASRPTLRQRWDLTRGATYSLSGQTQVILDHLEHPVEITTLFRPEPQVVFNGLAQVQHEAGEYVVNLLEEYVVAAGGQLSLNVLRPDIDRAEVEELVRAHHLSRYNVVLVVCEGRARQVYLEDLVTIDRGYASADTIQPAELRQYHGEAPLTSALLGVSDEDPPVVAFLQGHGEGNIDDYEVFGLGVLADAMRGQGMLVRRVDMSGRNDLPADVDMAVVISPEPEKFGRRATDVLRTFHEDGGALFLSLDPWASDADLDAFVGDLGVHRESALVARDDPLVTGPRRAAIVARRFDPDHPISAPIAKQGIFASMTGVGGLYRSPQVAARTGTPALLRTDEDVYGDQVGSSTEPGNFVFDEGEEVRGARTVAMAIEGGPGRVVIVGGSQFLTNGALAGREAGPGNMDLALNAMNWLAEREQVVDVPPREVYESRVDLFEGEQRDVFLYVVVYMPLGGALLGLLMWFIRRR